MVVLGLDAAVNRTGWAVVEKHDGREWLVNAGTLGRCTPEMRDEFAGQWRHVSAVAIEEPFLHENVQTLLVLAANMGAWVQAFGRHRLEAETIKADVWQLGILRGLIENRTKREGRKLAAQRWAMATFGLMKPLSEDEADAAGLATWCARKRAFAARAAIPPPLPKR